MGGIEGEGGRFDLTSQQSKPTEQPKPQLEEGNGAPGLPPTIHEQAKPPPEILVFEGHQSTTGQESQPETETLPTPAKRPRGRPRLPVEKVDPSTNVQSGNWLDRVEDLAWKEQYLKQLESNRAYKKANWEKVYAQHERRMQQRKEKGDPSYLELMEKKRARQRQRYYERKEERRLQAEKQQPTQVYPPPTQE